MDINNVDYDSELKPSIAVLRRISTDTHIKDSYLRLLARRLYLHKLVVYSAVLGYIILLFIACITFY